MAWSSVNQILNAEGAIATRISNVVNVSSPGDGNVYRGKIFALTEGAFEDPEMKLTLTLESFNSASGTWRKESFGSLMGAPGQTEGPGIEIPPELYGIDVRFTLQSETLKRYGVNLELGQDD